LNEMSNQVQRLFKQENRLDSLLKERIDLIEKQKVLLQAKKGYSQGISAHFTKLDALEAKYQASAGTLLALNQKLVTARATIEKALQHELSSRQGFPLLDEKMWIDVGREVLLVPTMVFQMVKSLPVSFMKTLAALSALAWMLFVLAEMSFTLLFISGYKRLSKQVAYYAMVNPGTISLRPLVVKWLHRNYMSVLVSANILAVMLWLGFPSQSIIFVASIIGVWCLFKGMITLAKLLLVEALADTDGHGVMLYRGLKWTFLVGGVVTVLATMMHQLPLVYGLKEIFDRLFLLFLLGVSLLLLRSWDVVPNLLLSHFNVERPYFQKSIRLIGILVPLILFANALVGLFGFVNLVLTIAWYEGVFLLVLIAYLILRDLLIVAMEQVSRLLIQYMNNGWLWTEAFVKPIYKIVSIALFFMTWAVLFLLYGWDGQSPIVARLTGLLQYHLVNVLDTDITPLSIFELFIVVSVFYWTAKWTREFVYRVLSSRTKDMGIRNSLAVFSQYFVIVVGGIICLEVLGIDFRALAVVAGAFAFGLGIGLRDLISNFAAGFLILLERPLRVGDIIQINNYEGEVTHIGGRAVSLRTWDNMEVLVPNSEVFNKSFTNWTAQDNIVRSVIPIKIGRCDNPHEVRDIIYGVLTHHKEVLKEPVPEVYLKQIDDTVMEFEVRYHVNIRQVKSRINVISSVLLAVWDEFTKHGIKPPYPQHEIFLRRDELPSPQGVRS